MRRFGGLHTACQCFFGGSGNHESPTVHIKHWHFGPMVPPNFGEVLQVMAKLGLLIVAVLAISCVFATSNYAIGGGNIVGLWLFDDEKGNVAEDSSENGNDGELLGNLEWVAGKSEGALSFPGVKGSSVMVPHNDSLTVTTYSICAWVKTPSGTGDPRVLVKGALASTYSYYLTIRSSQKVAFVGFSRKGDWPEAWGTKDVMDDQWHHLAGTYDGTTMRLYVDGEVDAEETHSGKPDEVENPVTIGADSDGVFPFNGIIDEVGLFSAALTENEVKRIMADGLLSITPVVTPVTPAGKLAAAWGQVKTR